MNHTVLNNGIQMPLLGFGVYQIDDPVECHRCVSEALRIGYRLIDTASGYLNETPVGRAIAQSGVPREELFVTTKLWVADSGYEKTKRAFEKSLKKLRLDYLDLYLIHQPFGDIYGSWRAMEELYKEGRIRAIGVSNFQSDRLMDFLMHQEVCPALNQIETHPFYQQTAAAAFLEAQKIQMESWGPFAEGRNGLFSNPVLQGLAQKHQRSIAQIVLRWLNQRKIVSIPKSSRPDRMAENFSIFDFELSDEDMASIASLDTGRSAFFDHRDPEVVKMINSWKFEDKD